jgi:hypothetical protein
MSWLMMVLALSLSTGQQRIVREAAAHYPGLPVAIVIERDAAASYQRFAERLAAALTSAGLEVTVSRGATADAGCPLREGIRVVYTPDRSGPATRIAESFQRSRVVSGSVPSCLAAGEGVLRFLIAD